MDVTKFTVKTNEVITGAELLASTLCHTEITPLHIAGALIDDPNSVLHQSLSNASPTAVATFINTIGLTLGALPRSYSVPVENSISPSLYEVFTRAQSFQESQGDSHLAVDHLILGLLEDPQIYQCLALEVGVPVAQIRSEVEKLRSGNEGCQNIFDEADFRELEKYGEDLVAQAAKLDPVIGRDEEIRRVIRILSRRTKNNPVIIGDPGVGKTAVVEGLAQRIARRDVPCNLADTRIISLDMGALIGGTKYRGEFEERLRMVLKKVKEANGKVIIFIDEIHLVLGAGRTEESGAMDAANLLKPLLARGQLRCIGATTVEEYRKYVEKDAAFERRFQQVYVTEPSVGDTVSILRGIRERYEGHHGVRIQDRALVVAAQLSNRYISGIWCETD